MPQPKKKLKKSYDFKMDSLGEFDELFIREAFVHIERMGDTAFWIGIYPPVKSGFPNIMLNTGVSKGRWYFNVEEDAVDGQSVSVTSPRKKAKRATT